MSRSVTDSFDEAILALERAEEAEGCERSEANRRALAAFGRALRGAVRSLRTTTAIGAAAGAAAADFLYRVAESAGWLAFLAGGAP